MPATLLAGAGICVGASTFSSLGLILMKREVSSDEADLLGPPHSSAVNLDAPENAPTVQAEEHQDAELGKVNDRDLAPSASASASASTTPTATLNATPTDPRHATSTPRHARSTPAGRHATSTPPGRHATSTPPALTPTSPRASPSRSSSFFEDLVETKDTSLRVLRLTNLRWGGGLLLFFLGQLLNLLALSHLTETTWAVISLFSLVANAGFAAVILGEAFTLRDLVCTLLILVGSACVVLSNSPSVANLLPPHPHADAATTVQRARPHESAGLRRVDVLLSHFSRPWFLSYVAFLLLLLLAAVLHAARSLGRGRRVQALTWTVFSGTCGSVSVMLGKCLAEMAAAALGDSDGLDGPVASRVLASASTYIILAVFAAAAALSLLSLTMALAAGEALLVVPWLTVTNTLLAILGGVFYFEDLSGLHSLSGILLFLSGVLLAVAGAWSLQAGREQLAQGGGNRSELAVGRGLGLGLGLGLAGKRSAGERTRAHAHEEAPLLRHGARARARARYDAMGAAGAAGAAVPTRTPGPGAAAGKLARGLFSWGAAGDDSIEVDAKVYEI